MTQSDNNNLSIGWASRDVTPDRSVNLRGQFHMRISNGIMDPITITALAISSEDSSSDSVIFVSCDTALISNALANQCRAAVRAKDPAIDINKIILNATHTHTAPQADERLYPPVPAGVMTAEEYAKLFVGRVAEAVVEAWNGRKPGGISWGLGTAVIGHNRRATYFEDIGARRNTSIAGCITDGYTIMYGNTNDPKFSHIEGYEDHYVDLLYTWDKDGRLTGVIANLACPSQEVEIEYKISADFWHNIRQEIRRKHGGHVQVLGQCSAAGDQSPHLMWYKAAEQRMLKLRGLSMKQEIGRRVACAVDDVLSFARQTIQTRAPLKHIVKKVALQSRMITEDEIAVVRADLAKLEGETPSEENRDFHYVSMQRCRKALKRHEIQKQNPKSSMELHVIRLGDLAFATSKFELFLDYGIRIKARSPATQTFLIQLAADDNYGGTYLPTARAVAGKGYGGGVYDNEVGPEGGQALVEETVKLLKELWPEAKGQESGIKPAFVRQHG